MAELVEVLSQIRACMEAMLLVLFVIEITLVVKNMGGRK